MVACACAALGAGVGPVAVSRAQGCGTTKVIRGHTMRVSVIRGYVSCSVARRVIRYSVDYTPGDLPPAWECGGSTRGTITCTRGKRTVIGRALYY
jgi:hypothetical protein